MMIMLQECDITVNPWPNPADERDYRDTGIPVRRFEVVTEVKTMRMPYLNARAKTLERR